MSRFINVFELTGSAMQKKGNFFALMFFVLGLGALAVYFVLGWCSAIVAHVCLLALPYEYEANRMLKGNQSQIPKTNCQRHAQTGPPIL